MVSCDYEKEPTLTARSERAIKEAKAAGVPKKRAIIITAASWNESAALISHTREPELLYSHDCYPCRKIVGWEWGRTNRVPKSWQEDPEVMKYLDERGQQIGKPLYTGSGESMRWTGAMAGYDGVKGNVEQARVFEWLMINRKASPLIAFSVGPTQQYLCYSPLVAKAYLDEGRTRPCEGSPPNQPGLTHIIAKRFPTWEHLFAFYMNREGGGGYLDPSYDYLPTEVGYFPYAGMPSCGDANDPSCVEYYLARHQTGFLDFEQPVWKGYAEKFANANNVCWNIANKVYG